MPNTTTPRSLESTLREKRDAGRKLLMPYVTAGIIPEWVDLVDALVAAGADAVEVGIPFSDPAMDGPTIQEASTLALANGITPLGALSALRDRDVGVTTQWHTADPEARFRLHGCRSKDLLLCVLMGELGFAQLCDARLLYPMPLLIQPWCAERGLLRPGRLPTKSFSQSLCVHRLGDKRLLLFDKRCATTS